MPRDKATTREVRAEKLFGLLCRGPIFRDGRSGGYTPDQASAAVRNWSYSHVLYELIDLVPELKRKYSGMMTKDFEKVIAGRIGPATLPGPVGPDAKLPEDIASASALAAELYDISADYRTKLEQLMAKYKVMRTAGADPIARTAAELWELFRPYPDIVAAKQSDVAGGPERVVVHFDGQRFDEQHPRYDYVARLGERRKLYERLRDAALEMASQVLGDAGYAFQRVDDDLQVTPKRAP